MTIGLSRSVNVIATTKASRRTRRSCLGVWGLLWLGPLGWRGVDHQRDALLRCRQLRDVMLRMCSAYVLLHGAVAFLLPVNIACYHRLLEHTLHYWHRVWL